MRAPQRSLKNWGDQKWRTKSGKKSSVTGERYLPEKAIKALSSAEYAATTAAKRRDKKKGQTIFKTTQVDHGKDQKLSDLDLIRILAPRVPNGCQP